MKAGFLLPCTDQDDRLNCAKAAEDFSALSLPQRMNKPNFPQVFEILDPSVVQSRVCKTQLSKT